MSSKSFEFGLNEFVDLSKSISFEKAMYLMNRELKEPEEDYQKSYELLKDLAEKGEPNSQYYLGLMYKKGQVVDINKELSDKELSDKWFTKSFKTHFDLAIDGNAESQYYLSLMYSNDYPDGFSYDEYEIKEFEWCKKSAEQGNSQAQFKLAGIYYFGSLGDFVEQNYEKAFEWCKKSAEQENEVAIYRLAQMYYDGKGVEQNYEKAFELYSKLAEKGDAYAQFYLAGMYFWGKGVEQNYEKAFEWGKKTSENGNVYAQFYLACMYFEGKGVEQDYVKAFEWFSKSAEQGEYRAQYSLGAMYYKGEGVKIDYTKAFEWFSKSAEQGNADAQNNLGFMYLKGQGVEQDYTKAFEWFCKSAEQGHVYAQNNLGFMYLKGQGVEQDYTKAFGCFSKSAEQGDKQAQYRIGYMYKEGLGVEQNFFKAIKYLKISADNGNEEAEYYILEIYEKIVFDVFNSIFFVDIVDNINISEIEKKLRTSNFEHYFEQFLISIEKSIDIKKYIDDLFKYFKYFKYLSSKLKTKLFELCSKSIDKIKNDDEFIMIMQGMLGTLILYGFGVKQNKSKAFELFLKSSEHGNTFAIYNLGCMYERGFGIEQDYKKAFDCFKKIELKDISGIAQYKLGEIYEQGLLGVQKDINKAIEYYKRASEQNASCLWHLGDIYFLGLGVKQDYNSAINYYISSTIGNYSESSNIYSNIEFYTLYELFVNDMRLNLRKKVAEYKDQVIRLADEGNLNALIHLGLMYQQGIGVDVNIKKAKEYYLKALEKKDELQDNIIYHFAEMYYYGKSRNFEENIYIAIELYSIVAEKGNKEAQRKLVDIYEFPGDNVKQDYDKLIYWYSKLAEQEDNIENIHYYQCRIADIYENKKQDYPKAIYWYSKVIEQGNDNRVSFAEKALERIKCIKDYTR